MPDPMSNRLPVLQDPRRPDPRRRSSTATSDVLAFKDIGPKAPFHDLVIPLEHIASLADADAPTTPSCSAT